MDLLSMGIIPYRMTALYSLKDKFLALPHEEKKVAQALFHRQYEDGFNDGYKKAKREFAKKNKKKTDDDDDDDDDDELYN